MDKKKQGKKTKGSSKKTKAKFCKYCGAELKGNTKACPSCKRKQGGKFKLVAIILIILLLALNAALAFFLYTGKTPSWIKTADSKKDNKKTTEEQEEENEEKEPEETTFSIGQPWVVDGQWSLTVNSIAATDQRNELDERTPAQVFIIDYTYENLGYADSNGAGLFLDLSSGQIVDSAEAMGYSYPGSITNHAQVTPAGAACSAQACIAVDNASTELKITVSQYDGAGAPHSATFVIPVG